MNGIGFLQSSLGQSTNVGCPPITTGYVVDVDDNQQNLRIRVCCPALGDDPHPKTMKKNNIPWATVAKDLSGILTQGFRGVASPVEGDVAYGLMGTPSVGTEAIVATVNGDPAYRIVIGYLTANGTANTLPHGRYVTTGQIPDGPYAVNDTKIQPLYDNITAMFTGIFGSPRNNFEYVTRGMDYSMSSHPAAFKNPRQQTQDPTKVTVTEADGTSFDYIPGYGPDRAGSQPDVTTYTEGSHGPRITGLVSPGFHAIAMDDRAENCRVRIRTTSGHQIIFDDTNERIYLSSSKGKNWVEMDSCGNIDIHSDTRVSIHAANDINMTAGGSIRMTAGDIHMRSHNTTRFFTGNDFNLISNTNIRIASKQSTFIESLDKLSILVATSINAESPKIDVLSSDTIKMTGNNSIHFKAGSSVVTTAGVVHTNSSVTAAEASSADPADAVTAFHTNRIPQHEPWPRLMTDISISDKNDEVSTNSINYQGNSLQDFEFKDYNDPNIGRIENGVALSRNQKWHR